MSLKAILEGVVALLGLIRDFFHAKENADSRQAGRDEATVAGQKREDDALAGIQSAIDEADKKPIDYRD